MHWEIFMVTHGYILFRVSVTIIIMTIICSLENYQKIHTAAKDNSFKYNSSDLKPFLFPLTFSYGR